MPDFPLQARCVLLTCRLTCRLPVDQIFKLPFLFLNFRWKHFVILFPYCFDHELREQDSKNQDDCSLKEKSGGSIFASWEMLNFKLGNGKLDCEDICFPVFGGWPLLKLMSFYSSTVCVTQGGCTGLVCSNLLCTHCEMSGEMCFF